MAPAAAALHLAAITVHCGLPMGNFVDRSSLAGCLPKNLHGFSSQVLDHYLAGRLSTAEFRRWFHMPNSDYLLLGDCIAQLVDPDYIPEAELPAAITLIPPKPKAL